MNQGARESVLEAAEEIRIVHLRRLNGELFESRYLRRVGVKPDPRGGCTLVALALPNGIFMGFADCSELDNYCKATGREIALGRAVKAALNGAVCYRNGNRVYDDSHTKEKHG